MCGFVAKSGETEPRVDRSRIMIEVRGNSLIPISEHSISFTDSRVYCSLTHIRLNLVSIASTKEGTGACGRRRCCQPLLTSQLQH